MTLYMGPDVLVANALSKLPKEHTIITSRQFCDYCEMIKSSLLMLGMSVYIEDNWPHVVDFVHKSDEEFILWGEDKIRTWQKKLYPTIKYCNNKYSKDISKILTKTAEEFSKKIVKESKVAKI